MTAICSRTHPDIRPVRMSLPIIPWWNIYWSRDLLIRRWRKMKRGQPGHEKRQHGPGPLCLCLSQSSSVGGLQGELGSSKFKGRLIRLPEPVTQSYWSVLETSDLLVNGGTWDHSHKPHSTAAALLSWENLWETNFLRFSQPMCCRVSQVRTCHVPSRGGLRSDRPSCDHFHEFYLS